MPALLTIPALGVLAQAAPFAAASAASTLISAAWEGAALVAMVALCLRLLPRLSAAARSMVWLNVFSLLMLLQLAPYLGAGAAGGGTAQPAAFQLGLGWCYAIAGAWIALSLFRGAQLVFSAVRLNRLARRATAVPLDDGELRTLLQVRTGTRIRRRAELCASDEVHRPSVFGFFHPRILIPPALLERLSGEELRQVVLHEMEHLRRGDDWTNLFQKMALVVFPVNPALLWVERQLCTERELACDDSVLQSSCGRKAYAVCLTHLAEYSMLRRGMFLALGAWERRPELVRRVHRILRRPTEMLGRRQSMALTGSLAVAMLGGAIALSHSPRLVGFAGPERPRANGQALMLGGPADTPSGALSHESDTKPGPKMVFAKAVMPAAPERVQQPRTADVAHGSTAAGIPVRRNAALRTVRKRAVPEQRQAWVVMTQWTDAGVPQRLVLTVAGERQASYAAIRTANGWIFIEI